MPTILRTASFFALMLGCATTSGTEPMASDAECPASATGTLEERPAACDVVHEGCCFADSTAACAYAGCPDECDILRTDPGQVECR